MKILFLSRMAFRSGRRQAGLPQGERNTVFNPALPDDDFERPSAIAQDEFDMHQPDVVVGSSRGGAVAMNLGGFAARSTVPGLAVVRIRSRCETRTIILHCRADSVVPFYDSEELLRNSGLGDVDRDRFRPSTCCRSSVPSNDVKLRTKFFWPRWTDSPGQTTLIIDRQASEPFSHPNWKSCDVPPPDGRAFDTQAEA
jgi:hypothetical protein